jgi:hypothetical protein
VRRYLGVSLCVAALGLCPARARAQSDEMTSALSLFVTVKPDSTPGLYDYTFELDLTNRTETWAPGQGYGGFVFGDARYATSPIADFQIDSSSSPVGPWTSLTTVGDDGTGLSYHNGLIFAPQFDSSFNIDYWYPTGIGDFLKWSGVSSADISPSKLTFSTIFTTGGAVPANFQPALATVPEPSSLVQLILGATIVLGALAYRRRAVARGRMRHGLLAR